MAALSLHAITLFDGGHPEPPGLAEGARIIQVRDLCAVVTEQPTFAVNEPGPNEVAAHRAVVDRLFRSVTVIPAPVGVVFRAEDVLTRWIELHYVAISDALAFVEDRVAARVHATRKAGEVDSKEAGADLASAATEAFRALRRRAVATVPLRLEEVTGLMLSGAFLVERELWKEFLAAVDEQRDAHHLLRFDVTGPWAPYDFVHMQFGA